MADDTNFRSYRSGGPLGRGAPTPAASDRDGGSDPLAELARLIGQNDPFADLGRGGTPRAARAPGAAMYTDAPDWQPHANPAAPAYRDAYNAPQAPHPQQQFNNPPEGQSYADPRQDHGFQAAYDPAVHGDAQHDGEGYGADTYYEGPAHMSQGDEGYDDIPEARPRRGLKTLMALTALVIVGAGGAFAYRAMFGTGGSVMPPPVIKADTTPSKVGPAQSGEQSKLIYDRVGDTAKGEKVVSREEQPVDIDSSRSAAPRTVLPGIPLAPEKPDSSATISSTLAALPSVGPASAEPKKVRTVTIRPDQPMGLDSSAAKPNAAAPRNIGAAATATPSTEAFPAGPRYVAPKPGSSAPPPASAPANAPLSISPQVNTDAPRSAPPTRAATAVETPTARIASIASGSEAGSYTVQLSSQRSEPEAQASFRTLQTKFPNLLSNRQPIIRRADLGEKGIYFRAMVGPFASAEEASGFCSSLKSAGGQCVVQRN